MRPDRLLPSKTARRESLGAMCLLIHFNNKGEEEIVLVTVPDEDWKIQKSERLASGGTMNAIVKGTQSVFGGKIEVNEDAVIAIHREAKEELGLTLRDGRLQEIYARPFQVFQQVDGNCDRNGLHQFSVVGFRYYLSDQEFKQLNAYLVQHGRELQVFSRQEVQRLPGSLFIRPSTLGLIAISGFADFV